MTKYIPTLLPIFTLIGTAVTPSIQHFLSGHGLAVTIIGAVAAIINHWLPSPAAA